MIRHLTRVLAGSIASLVGSVALHAASEAEPPAQEWLSCQTLHHSLLRKPIAGDKVSVWSIAIDSDDLPNADHLCWSADGARLYIGEACGQVLSCHLPDLTVDAVGDCLGSIDCIRLCKTGLVATVDGRLVEILDPDSLEVKRRFKVAHARRIAALSSSSTLFICCDGEDLLFHELTVIDAVTGATLKSPKIMDIVERAKQKIKIAPRGIPIATGWEDIFLAADGKYLLSTGFGCMHRFAVHGADLAYEEISAPYVASRRFYPSPDGKYVAVWDTNNAEGLGQRAAGSYYIYRVSDLGVAAITIPLERRESLGLLYARQRKSFITLGWESLTIVAAAGGATESRALPQGTGQFQWMAGAPDGSGCVIDSNSGRGLQWIAIDGIAAAKGAP